MLHVAITLQEAINAYFETYADDDVVDDYLDDEDWQTLKQIKEFLEPLKACTKSLESSTRGLDSVLPAMDFILAHFETAKVQYRNNKVLHYSTNFD
jgi:hypothetical protein